MPASCAVGGAEVVVGEDVRGFGECLICLETDLPEDQLVTNFCGATLDQKSFCATASICHNCVTSLIKVTLEDTLFGLLPRIRCPLCLVQVNKKRWQTLVAPTQPQLLALYENLCQRSCVLTCPGCHSAEYSHLPACMQEESNEPNGSDEYRVDLTPTMKRQIPELHRLCRAFCDHRVEPSMLYNFMVDTFSDAKLPELLHQVLVRIYDEERRASLLLHHLHKQPDIETTCCKAPVCFNCKTSGFHHGKCGELDLTFDEENALVQCRKCRVWLLKTDGCSSVVCMCGLWMDWNMEVEIARMAKRKLSPVTDFDIEYVLWRNHKEELRNVHFGLSDHFATKRLNQLTEMVIKHRNAFWWLVQGFVNHLRYRKAVTERSLKAQIHQMALRVLLTTHQHAWKRLVLQRVWRMRFRKLVTPHHLCDRWITMRFNTLDYKQKTALRNALLRIVYVKRWRKSSVELLRELEWALYYRSHPEEKQELDTMLREMWTIGMDLDV